MFSQFRRINGYNVFIRQTGSMDYEVTINNGQPVFIQSHKPATWFQLVGLGLKAASGQMELNLESPEFCTTPPDADDNLPEFDPELFNKHFPDR